MKTRTARLMGYRCWWWNYENTYEINQFYQPGSNQIDFHIDLEKKKKKKISISNLGANKVSHETNSCSLGKLSYAHVLTQNQSNLIKHLNFIVQNIVHSWGVLRLYNNKLIQNQIKIKLFKALEDAIANQNLVTVPDGRYFPIFFTCFLCQVVMHSKWIYQISS